MESDDPAVSVVGDGTTRRCGEVSGETCAAGEWRRSQSLHGTVAVVSREKRREQSCAEGREAGRWIGEFHREAERKQSAASVRRDYAKRRDARPGSVVSGNLAVERTHVGGAGQRRHRRQIANVFFAAQGLFTIIAARVLASQSRCGKPPTGEPCAGEPHARFGGRGRREPFPTPINFGIDSHYF